MTGRKTEVNQAAPQTPTQSPSSLQASPARPADTPFRLLVLNDMHVAMPGTPYHHRNTAAIFRRTLETLCRSRRPDLLILNGDLCATVPDPATYRYIARLLHQLQLPALALPGNHDDPRLMHRSFPHPAHVLADQGAPLVLTCPDDPYCGWARLHDWGITWLNSYDHRVSQAQLDWLQDNAAHLHADHGNILFIHHPPAAVPSRFMEAHYPLYNRDSVLAAIEQLPALQRIFCGHYHRSYEHPRLPLSMVNSSLYSIDPESPNHRVLHHNPGYAWIELTQGLHYTVAELPENMLH